MLSICSFIEIDGEVKPITPELVAGAQKIADDLDAEPVEVEVEEPAQDAE